MAEEDVSDDLAILSIDEARARGLDPLTIAEPPTTPIQVGDGTRSMRYIEWLTMERKRIMRSRDRRAEIVVDGKGRVSLWVNYVAHG